MCHISATSFNNVFGSLSPSGPQRPVNYVFNPGFLPWYDVSVSQVNPRGYKSRVIIYTAGWTGATRGEWNYPDFVSEFTYHVNPPTKLGLESLTDVGWQTTAAEAENSEIK